MTRYVIITPARDEEQHIEATIESVIGQTLRPAEWVIVDDGSTDRTSEILDQYAAQFPWIRLVHRPNRGFRKSGGGVVEAFYEGYDSLQCDAWDFIVKLDGDLSFSPDYFQRCFEHFREQPRLGIGGGDIYHDLDGELRLEANPKFHIRGATKIYRRPCWEDIGGLWPGPGWDTIDEVKGILVSMIAPTHREEGCLKYELFQNTADPSDFTFIEEWTDGPALDRHLAMPHIDGVQPRLREIVAEPTDVRRYSHLSGT